MKDFNETWKLKFLILNDIDQMGNEFHLDKCKVKHREEPPPPVCLLIYDQKRNFDATVDIFLTVSWWAKRWIVLGTK